MDYSNADSVVSKPQARTQTNAPGTLLFFRSLLLAIAVGICLEKKEGVPARSKASQRDGVREKGKKCIPSSTPSTGYN